MKLPVLYEDEDIAVIEKPAGIAVHPGAGHDTTLIDLLREQFEHLSLLPGEDRPGLVHRLDLDTSGLLLIAKTDAGYESLQAQMKGKKIQKYYSALVCDHLKNRLGTIEAPIGRSYQNRKKMTSFTASGRDSVTHFEVKEFFSSPRPVTFVDVRLETGRTHQIRVHFQAIGHPVVGDPDYGRRSVNQEFQKLFGLARQFLHAYKLEFTLLDGTKKIIETKLPDDLLSVLKNLS
jgi:23S rRNA pseudouridine1911/1915/1917 synthase